MGPQVEVRFLRTWLFQNIFILNQVKIPFLKKQNLFLKTIPTGEEESGDG